MIGTPWQRAGNATEATGAVVAWLRECGIRSFEAHIHPSHDASAAVASRLGLVVTQPREDGEVRWAGDGAQPPAR